MSELYFNVISNWRWVSIFGTNCGRYAVRNIATLLLSASLCACADIPPQLNLTPTAGLRASKSFPVELKAVTVTADPSVKVQQIMADATLILLWKDSIQTTVDQAGLFTDDAPRKVNIVTTVKKYAFNTFGFSNTANVVAHYSVVERSTGNELFQTDIDTSASCSISEHPNYGANGRIIKAVNDATQDNVRQFVTAIEQHGIN